MGSNLRAIWKRLDVPWWGWCFPLLSAGDLLSNAFAVNQVSGRSMQPTLNPNSSTSPDYVLVNKCALWFNDYNLKRGDVVALRSPIDPKLLIVKRIVGLPGDRVVLRNSQSPVDIPNGHLWIEGDETFHTRDSTTYGPVATGLVQGTITHIVWPPSRWGKIGNPRSSTHGLHSL